MKCACSVCGKHIEYDASAAGVEIACPHCGNTTRLAAYSAAPPIQPPVAVQPAASKGNVWIIVAVLAVGLVLVVPIIGLLAAIAIPNFVKARSVAQKNACVANLRMIDGAKRTWALEHKKSESAEPTDSDLFGPTLYIRQKPACPANGIYTIGRVDEKPTCTIPGHEL